METYKKPIYNPFLDLNPPKGMIEDVVKSLKNQAYATQRKSQEWTDQGWPVPSWLEQEHKKIITRIKDYQYRLAGWSKDSGWRNNNGSTIGDVEIRRAKEVRIETIYVGRLRKTGRTLVGTCPLHSERTPSFTIYSDTNRWHCFGCSVGGDSIDLIMKLNDLSMPEAIKYLLNK